MIDAETLSELRLWVQDYGLSKYEVFLVFVVVLIFMRLPTILKHLRETRAIERDFQHRSKALAGKLEKERRRRGKK